jgi:hypothetical protein
MRPKISGLQLLSHSGAKRFRSIT